jgi:transposase-like protein
MVFEHAREHPSQWAAMRSIAEKLGCTTEAVRRWVRQAERDRGERPGMTPDERQRCVGPTRDGSGVTEHRDY